MKEKQKKLKEKTETERCGRSRRWSKKRKRSI